MQRRNTAPKMEMSGIPKQKKFEQPKAATRYAKNEKRKHSCKSGFVQPDAVWLLCGDRQGVTL